VKTCKQFQAVVEALCAQHQVDLRQVGAHLRLENESYEPLVIERIAEHQVSIAHYYYQNGDAIADPDVVLFTAYAEWAPISIQQPTVALMGCALGGYRVVAELTEDGANIARFYPQAQADVAGFCSLWARNLKAQGWLDHAIKVDSLRPAQERAE
jgi:hypothetical protein